MSAWHDYKLTVQKGTSVAIQLDREQKNLVERNRHYLKAIAEVILLCSFQEIALRGHDESDSSSNKENF